MMSVTATDIIVLTASILVAMFLAVVGYRAMQHPRVVLTQTVDGQWRASRRDAIKYAISIPLLLLAWNVFLLVILLSGDNWLDGPRSLVVATSVIAAARILAHLSPERAHELAKSVPLTLVTLLLISGGFRGLTETIKILDQLAHTDVSGPALAVPLILELTTTAVWYWVGVRVMWARGYRVPGLPTPPNPKRVSQTTRLD